MNRATHSHARFGAKTLSTMPALKIHSADCRARTRDLRVDTQAREVPEDKSHETRGDGVTALGGRRTEVGVDRGEGGANDDDVKEGEEEGSAQIEEETAWPRPHRKPVESGEVLGHRCLHARESSGGERGKGWQKQRPRRAPPCDS